MIAAVNPTSNGFGGGSYTPAGRPTGVSGPFSSPGTTAATPPGVPASSVIEARNDRGSNVTIPYARLVPMHARVNSHSKSDNRQLLVKGAPQLEYDGLHSGELGWILGRRSKGDGTEMSAPERYAHQAMSGLGTGVDRMQRLASTGWMESLFNEKLGSKTIPLHSLKLTNDFAKANDASIAEFHGYIHGSTALQVPDVTWWRAMLEGEKAFGAVGHKSAPEGNNSGRRFQGIDVVTTGPFLRGVQVDSSVVRFNGDVVKHATSPEDLPRNMGDSLAFCALDAELRKHNLLDWTPDGIVLSKLESPTDDPMKSTELDARQAQLFNVGVQGPAISTSWTSDLKDHRLEVQPMDKVFVCLVATVAYRVDDSANGAYETMRKAQQAVLAEMEAFQKLAKAGADEATIGTAKTKLTDAMDDAEGPADDYIKAAEAATLPAYIKKDGSKLGLKGELPEPGSVSQAEADEITKRSEATRKNKKAVTQAYLTNFRLMRTTSSHMSNYSHYRPGDKNSRMGLKLSAHAGTDDDYSGAAEVIVGGWCVGTVIDSAASRSTVGFQTVKSHPTSMACNVNVNVSWWSGDKLFKHYMDVGGQVERRGQKRKELKTDEGKAEVAENVDALPDLSTTPAAPGTRAESGVAGSADSATTIPPMPPREVRQRTETAAAAASSSLFGVPARGASRRA